MIPRVLEFGIRRNGSGPQNDLTLDDNLLTQRHGTRRLELMRLDVHQSDTCRYKSYNILTPSKTR